MKDGTAPDEGRKELAYRLLNGFVEADGELSRGQMQIQFLVELIYQHRLNLCGKTGLDFEDRDLEAVIAAYERLGHLCAGLMYDQGWHDAERLFARENENAVPEARASGAAVEGNRM